MSKIVYKYSEIQDKILHAVDTITDPIAGTLSPRGCNVIYEDEGGDQFVTNDGVTIAKQIQLEDEVENAIVDVIKYSALKTNYEAGDGCQPLWCKIATPDGFKTMADIQVGDVILDSKTSKQRVLGVFDKGVKTICNVKFSDGRIVECSLDDHLWTVVKDSGCKTTLTTRQILESGLYREKGNGDIQYKYFVPKSKANHSEKELLLDPYLIGVLIGDGSLSGSGSIEISLGEKKKHIINKLTLPDGIIINARYDDKKNYYRIKIVGKTKEGLYIKDLLEELGLFGCKSSTKFIPSDYLYSNIEQREQLLQGLTDTDGHVNKKSLLEYSTVSKQLADDICELMRGLGKTATIHLHSRKNDPDSYSNNPIYRINELKGYKYGDKIVDIEVTDRTTKMKCIKVSNPDGLYLTDGYITTHNTSTTILLASILIKGGLKLITDGWNPMQLKKEYEKFGAYIKSNLVKKVKKIKNDKDLFYIANISANNDEEIAKNVVRTVKIAGQDGLVFFDSKGRIETEIEEDIGFMVNSGMFLPECTNSKDRFIAMYKDVPVLVTDKRLYYAQEAETILKTCLDNGYKEVVIVARDFIGEAVPYFMTNHVENTIKVLLIKDPKATDNSHETLEDLSIYLGGKLITDKTGSIVDNLKMKDFFMAKKVYSDLTKTIILRDKEEKNPGLKKRIRMLKDEIKRLGDSDIAVTEVLKKRLAALTNGMVTIYAGGSTHLEIREKVFRYEDSVNATRAAQRDGYLVGGGISMMKATGLDKYKCDSDLMKVFKKYTEANVRQIAKNCGLFPDNVIETVNLGNENIGYNALTEQYEDLLKTGVVDPYRVIELCIDNSISIANVIISSNYLIVNILDNKKENGSKK